MDKETVYELFFAAATGVAIILLLIFLAKEVLAAEPVIIETKGYPRAACDQTSGLWECRPCEQPGQEQKRCVCRYCVNESTGKTVEKDNDLRSVYCFVGDNDS